MSGLSLETRLGVKFVNSVHQLVKVIRTTGPFGGASIDTVSLTDILKKSEEESEQIIKKIKAGEKLKGYGRTVRIYFEDKYEKSQRIAIEEVRVEVCQLPRELNGFEYLCHPSLEKDENLISYFKAWHSTSILSLYYLLQESPLGSYFLNPVTPEEIEVSNELRKWYNLTIESEEVEPQIHSPTNQANTPGRVSNLEVNLRVRHDIKSALIKLKVSTLKNYKAIIDGINLEKKTPVTIKPPTNSRHRFMSEGFPERAIMARRMAGRDPASYKNSMDMTSTNPMNSSGDLMTSFKSNVQRPFKAHDAILEERAFQSRRRMSIGQSTAVDTFPSQRYRKSSHLTADEMDYVLTEIDGEAYSHSSRSRRSPVYNENDTKTGLAMIGHNLIESGDMQKDELEPDEDDRMVEISNSIECAQMAMRVIKPIVSERQPPSEGNMFKPIRLILNLPDKQSKPIQDYLTLGEWLVAQKRMCRLSKECMFSGNQIHACDHDFTLGRRTYEQLTTISSETGVPSQSGKDLEVSSPPPMPKNSLSAEINHLIKWSREKNNALKAKKEAKYPCCQENDIIVPIIENFPTKKLIGSDMVNKFGLINKKSIGTGAFVHKEHYVSPPQEEQNPTILDLSQKLDQALFSQQMLLKTVLYNNQQMTVQIETLKKQVRELSQQLEKKPVVVSGDASHLVQDKMEAVNKFSLLSYLCPKGSFKYCIEPVNQLDPVFVKERNFRAEFKVVNKEDGTPIDPATEGLFLEFKLYSTENPPKQIELNTCGNSILKGNTVREVVNSRCSFEKLQIKEVSSHFRNGWVFIVVQPKTLSDSPHSSLMSSELLSQIQPFVMDNVVVKAKLNTKKRDDHEEDKD